MEILRHAVKALDDKKAIDIKAIEVTEVTVLADYFAIATATSSTHVRALAESVEEALSNQGVEPHHIDIVYQGNRGGHCEGGQRGAGREGLQLDLFNLLTDIDRFQRRAAHKHLLLNDGQVVREGDTLQVVAVGKDLPTEFGYRVGNRHSGQAIALVEDTAADRGQPLGQGDLL